MITECQREKLRKILTRFERKREQENKLFSLRTALNQNIKINAQPEKMETYIKSVEDKIELANTLIEKLENDFPSVDGSLKTRRNIVKEIKFLEKVNIYCKFVIVIVRTISNILQSFNFS